MAKTPITIARTIANALNQQFKTHIVINVSQFYGGEGKLVRMYIVKDSYYRAGKYTDKELFKTASGVYACLFMRDLLKSFQNEPLPPEDNEGYKRVLEKRNGRASISYMKEVYLDESRLSDR